MDILNEILQKIGLFFKESGWKIVLVLAIIIICFFLIRLIIFILKKILYKTKIDNAVITFISSIIKIFLWIFIIFVIAKILEISYESIIVACSSLALAVGLALKDSLANLANGILIIINKPFKRGDYIKVDAVEGKIFNIKLLTTELITADNKKIIVPNSSIINSSITNFDACLTRRLDVQYTVSYESDMKNVQKVLINVATNHHLVLNSPAPVVFMSNHLDSSIEFTLRVWVNTSEYWDLKNSINYIVFEEFKKQKIDIPFPIVDLRINKGETDEKN